MSLFCLIGMNAKTITFSYDGEIVPNNGTVFYPLENAELDKSIPGLIFVRDHSSFFLETDSDEPFSLRLTSNEDIELFAMGDCISGKNIIMDNNSFTPYQPVKFEISKNFMFETGEILDIPAITIKIEAWYNDNPNEITNITINFEGGILRDVQFNKDLFGYYILSEEDKTVALISYSGIEEIVNVPSTVEYLDVDYTVISIGLYDEDSNISYYPFRSLQIKEIKLPETIKIISREAFRDCPYLTNIDIPNSVEIIEEGVFDGCTGLTVMKLPENITSIPSGLFYNCTGLEKVYFSEKVNSFGANAFNNCTSLRSIIIPEGVETIPESMMQNCSSLTEILIPNSVETIGKEAFQGCASLKNIDLGMGLYSIGDYAFADCPNITDIHCMALNPPYAEMYTFPTSAYSNATVTVREQSLSTYNRENPWYRFQNYLTVSGAISLSHYNVDMAGNEVFQLGVYGSDSEIQWSSSNPTVAYANNCGLIVAMGITGSTVITATVDDEEINCNVTVSSPYRDPQAYYSTRAGDDEELQPVDVIIESISGNPPMINARLVPVGSKTIIDWTSSNSNIASVENGIVTVYSNGDVDFGVETENGLEETIVVDTQNIEQAGIDAIFSDTDKIMPMNVYDLNGRIIYFNATLEQIKSLDKGLYIIKGKKVLIN